MSAAICDQCGERGTPKVRVMKRPDGQRLHAACRPDTESDRKIAWAKANPEKVAIYKARWYEKNADRLRDRARQYRESLSPEERRERSRRSEARNIDAVRRRRRLNNLRRYGLTPDDYDAMLAEQKGVCAICGGPEATGRLCVDHNHSTGAVRQLLCRRCNVAVGMFENDGAHLIESVRAYLEAHR